MNKTITTMMAVVLMAPTLFAQIEIKLKMQHEAYIQYEAVNAIATIANAGQMMLRITADGTSRDDIGFLITKGRDDFIDQSTRAKVVETLKLEPGERRDIMVNIAKHYDLSANGRYMIALHITHGGKTYSSNNQMVDIVTGIDMKAVSRSVQGFPDDVRKYQLKYWGRDGAEEVFVKVTDADDILCYGVFGLGRILRVTEPMMTFDERGDLYVIHQRTKDCYVRSKFITDKNNVKMDDQRYFLPSGEPFPLLGAESDNNADQVGTEKASRSDVKVKEAGQAAEKPVVESKQAAVEKQQPKKKSKPALFYFRKSEVGK